MRSKHARRGYTRGKARLPQSGARVRSSRLEIADLPSPCQHFLFFLFFFILSNFEDGSRLGHTSITTPPSGIHT